MTSAEESLEEQIRRVPVCSAELWDALLLCRPLKSGNQMREIRRQGQDASIEHRQRATPRQGLMVIDLALELHRRAKDPESPAPVKLKLHWHRTSRSRATRSGQRRPDSKAQKLVGLWQVVCNLRLVESSIDQLVTVPASRKPEKRWLGIWFCALGIVLRPRVWCRAGGSSNCSRACSRCAASPHSAPRSGVHPRPGTRTA